MKRLGITVLLIFGLVTSAFAGKTVNVRRLTDWEGTTMTDYALINGNEITTESVKFNGAVGFASLLVTGTGDVDIDMELSADGTNFYDPYTTDGTTCDSVTSVMDSVTTDRWLVLTARLAPYIRFKIDPDAASTMTFTIIYQEEY